ncbi:retrotransposon protein, putative, ty1-copia subclass, partial [Tanacetum coccineum]
SESNKWIDAMNAEIQSMMDNMVWVLVDIPPGCKTVGSFVDLNHPKKVCKLQRSIYGLKQSSRSWNKRFDEEIKRFGFDQNLDESCVYQKASGSNVTFLILYVDDIIIMGNHIPSLQSVKDYLGKCFAMKYLWEEAFILGIKIYRDRSN